MSRDIRFRAWVKPIKKMAEVTGWVNDSVFLKADTGSGSNDLENVELMQYTGLCDRKGQKIYEDDIVTFDDAHYRVAFTRGEWVLQAIHSNNENDLISLYMQELSRQPGRTRTDVVSNIYENPELLKKAA